MFDGMSYSDGLVISQNLMYVGYINHFCCRFTLNSISVLAGLSPDGWEKLCDKYFSNRERETLLIRYSHKPYKIYN